jgi:hypothetical protein
MSALSDYLEQSILNNIFRAQSIATLHATNNYYALFTAAPSDSGGGTECSGTAYARAALARNVTTNFDAPSSGATQNAAAIDFGTAGSGGWGTVLAVGVFDALTGGNLLLHGSISPSKTINANDPASFAIGDFDVALTGSFSSYLRDVILNWLFRNGTWPTWNADVSVSLHTNDPGLTGTNEVIGGNYSRVNIARGTGAFTAPGVGGLTDNVSQITFNTPSGANWGSISWAGIWDGGGTNFLFKAQLAVAKTVNDGDQAPYIAAGELDIQIG